MKQNTLAIAQKRLTGKVRVRARTLGKDRVRARTLGKDRARARTLARPVSSSIVVPWAARNFLFWQGNR